MKCGGLRNDIAIMIELTGLRSDFPIDPSRNGDISDDAETRKCFPSKAIRSNRHDILKTRDFAGSVTLAEIVSVIDGDTSAVISTLEG
jgi:hypothetical protein